MKLKGNKVCLKMTTVGNVTSELETVEYTVHLLDKQGLSVPIKALSMDSISSPICKIDRKRICDIFDLPDNEFTRPIDGEVDLLIGLHYAAYHPDRIKADGHLILYENRFGKTVGGSHPTIHESTKLSKSCLNARSAAVMHAMGNDLNTFFQMEGLGINCSPRCGSCACGSCHPGGKSMILKEEKELEMIDKGLYFNTGRWVASFPWNKSQSELTNNRKIVVAKLI